MNGSSKDKESTDWLSGSFNTVKRNKTMRNRNIAPKGYYSKTLKAFRASSMKMYLDDCVAGIDKVKAWNDHKSRVAQALESAQIAKSV